MSDEAVQAGDVFQLCIRVEQKPGCMVGICHIEIMLFLEVSEGIGYPFSVEELVPNDASQIYLRRQRS